MVFKSADFGFLRLADRATYPWEPLSSSTVLFIKDMGWDGQESKSPGILLSRQRASECALSGWILHTLVDCQQQQQNHGWSLVYDRPSPRTTL